MGLKNIKFGKMNQKTRSSLITYCMVLLAFVLVQIMISAGSMSNLMKGILVPLCLSLIHI